MNILLVEDEARVADFVRRGLRAEGWNVEHVGSGEAALEACVVPIHDAIVLDLMLPGMSGQDVCRLLRARGNVTPVLMLTALDTAEERVEGLRLGADDYLPKPFDFDELIARIHALVRRDRDYRTAPAERDLRHDGVVIDTESLIVRIDDTPIDLTCKERELLTLFLGNVGKALSRERILGAVWGLSEDPLTNVVDVYISRLRKKLGPYGGQLVTVRGSGYRYGV